jgi:tRNA (guanosine-2'-O-)-methyltransferase
MTERIIALLKEHATEKRWSNFERVIEDRTRYITMVLEDIYQPHNASAVMRSCDCFGVQDIHIIENRNTYEVNPEVALGSTQWLHLERYNEPDQANSIRCAKALRAKGYVLVATSPHADGYTSATVPLDRPLALLMGTEGRGLSDELLATADYHLRIPMYGFTESYNLSVSAAMIMHRLSERLRSSTVNWQLNPEEKSEILLSWLKKSIRNSESIIREIERGLE